MSGALWLVALAAIAAEPSYRLETKPATRVTATLTFEAQADKLKASEWIVYAAAAPTTAGQTDVRTHMTPAAKLVQEQSPLARPVLLARIPGKKAFQKQVKVTVKYEATLWSRRLGALAAGERPPVVATLPKTEREAALDLTADLDFQDETFQDWQQKHKLVRGPAESDIDFARRVFTAIRRELQYDYQPEMDRAPAAVCAAGKSDCGGLSNLLVATLRSQGIPARTLAGRWAMSAEPGAKLSGIEYHQYHVKAEFFAAGVGWVPVDMASGILHDRSREGLRYFGRDDGDFLVQNVDSGLEVDSIHFGRQTLLNLQRPSFWVAGTGSLDGLTTHDGWIVEHAIP